MKGQATSTLLDENLTREVKHKKSFTLVKSCMKTQQFILPVKSSLFFSLIDEPDTKGKENSPTFLCGLL